MKVFKNLSAGSMICSAALSCLFMAGPANASAIEYTSQSAFDAANPTASTFNFNANGAISVEPNPVTINNVTFTDEVTAADAANGGTPLIFLIDDTDTPTYGRDFLSFQNTQFGNVAEISTAGATAFGFNYGTYVPTGGDATVTLSTGETYTITPTSTESFIGFSDSTPVTSITVDYPQSVSFDVLSVSTISAAPEPATWVLMLLGLGGVGVALRQEKCKRGLPTANALAIRA